MRRLLLAATVLLIAWALFVAISGGIDTRIAGVAIRARDVVRPLTIGFVLLVVHSLFYRERSTRAADRLDALLARFGSAIALVAALLLAVHSAWFGTMVAGGSGSYGHVSQACRCARGSLPGRAGLPPAPPFRS